MGRGDTIYLDHNATAPVRSEARAAALSAIDVGANASSVHYAGRQARAMVEKAREHVGALVGALPERVIFTSGGTEANALAILGAARAGLFRSLHVFALEHDSVLRTARDLAAHGEFEFGEIGTMPSGEIDLVELELALRSAAKPALVCVMAANNETGVVQPLELVRALCTNHGALLHVDAIQIAGRLPFDASAFDLVTLSAHKLGGLQGAGALILGPGIEVEPLWGGGAQERRRRPGTEPVAAIAAFGAAARAAVAEIDRAGDHAAWRDALEARLADVFLDLHIFGRGAGRLPQTSCLGVPGCAAETQVIALDLEGIAVSAGSACSSGKVSASHIISAMGYDDAAARSAIRVSFGWGTRREELDRFTDVWERLLTRSRDVQRELIAAGV